MEKVPNNYINDVLINIDQQILDYLPNVRVRKTNKIKINATQTKLNVT